MPRAKVAKSQEIAHRLPPWTPSNLVGPLTEKEWDWPHRKLLLPDVWKKHRGAGVKVAVLDTGIDANHDDLKGQIIAAKDFTGSRSGHADKMGHGTHCAGIIAAVEDDKGIMGGSPDLGKDGGGLIIAKVLGDDGSGQSSWIARGIEWAISQGAKIVSMSLGSPFRDDRIIDAIKLGLSADVIFVCAAGNEGQRGVGWPGAYEGVISVAAYDKNFQIAPFSSRGPEVDIAAPGVDILSTVPVNSYARMSGTSMATPWVASICALLISSNKKVKWDCAKVKAKLIGQAQDAGSPGFDNDYGYGLIRPDRIEGEGVPPPVVPPIGDKPGIEIGGGYFKGPIVLDGWNGVFVGFTKVAK